MSNGEVAADPAGPCEAIPHFSVGTFESVLAYAPANSRKPPILAYKEESDTMMGRDGVRLSIPSNGERTEGVSEAKGDVVYFEHCGEVNTVRTLEIACDRAEALGTRSVVIASETGQSALAALNVFKACPARLIVVTHYPATTWGPDGEILIGLKRPERAETRRRLEESGVTIVQGTRPFAPPSRSLDWNFPTPEGMVDQALTVLGAGTKIAIEASLMATDAGEVGVGEEIIACAGTYKGLDTALVVRTAYTMNFFTDFEVVEILARPRHRVRKLPEYEWDDWKGNLSPYYTLDDEQG